ncbi:hypothetical protein [Nocardia cyriacigeorgica]|nr:hypothetical protein [Nocardia cyriacigeorgica]
MCGDDAEKTAESAGVATMPSQNQWVGHIFAAISPKIWSGLGA